MTEKTTAGCGAEAGQVERPVRPSAWMVRQGSRTYYLSDAEFVRSSYDSGEFVPLYPPEALAAERERCAARVEQAFREGYWARETYNDSEVSDADAKWASAKAGLLRA